MFRLFCGLGLSALVVGCRASDVPQGRYACDSAGDRSVGSPQCPGDSRCGLEGYCHDVGDTSVRWKCATAEDCEGGWQCGLSSDGETRECHDPAIGEPFRCAQASDCSAGWTCGLDDSRLRRCHDPSRPKTWPCDSTADCVGGWQCGLAATGGKECHDPANPAAWPCLVATDCLGGWQCGLNDARTGRECHDPQRPRAFSCEVASDCLANWSCGLNDSRTGRECHDPQSARSFACEVPSDCLGNWVCGLNDSRTGRECHDPANPRSFACEVPSDCLGNWVCGLNDARTARQCHDPANPRTFACLVDADCVASWRCGLAANRLQRECHDPANPQAWACAGDSDCLGGWRCSNDGLCVDPSGDALQATSPRDGGVDLVSPLESADLRRVSISPLFRTPDGRDVTVVAMVRNGKLEAVTREAGAFRRWTTSIDTQGPLITSGSRWVRNVSSFPGQERANTPMVFVTLLDGGLLAVELLADAGVSTSPVQDPFDTQAPALTDLRLGTALEYTDGGAPTGVDLPYVLGFSRRSSAEYTLFDGPERSVTRTIYTFMGLPDIARPGNVILDVANIYFPRPGGGTTVSLECTFLVDTAGLWVMADDSRFEPLHSAAFGNSACGATGQRVERFSTIDAHRAVVVSSPWDGGTRAVSAWDLSGFLPVAGQNPTGFWCQHDWTQSMNMCRPLDRGMPAVTIGPCAACPAGDLLSVSAVTTPGQPLELEARCGAPDAGSYAFFRHSARPGTPGACTTRLIASTSSLFFQPSLATTDQPTPGRVAYVSPSGRLWTGADALTASSLHFDVATRGILRIGPPLSQHVVVGDGVVGLFTPRFGLAGVARSTPTAVGLDEPSWAVVGNQVVSFARSSSIDAPVPLAVSGASLPAGQLLVRALTATGEVVAVVAAGNQVWTARVDDTSLSPPPPSLLVPRLTTLGAIGSIAVTTGSADAGVAMTGYAATSFGVSRLTASSLTSWRADDVPLPPGLTPKEVWFTSGRGRVGFSSGEVYALPSRVPIAPALDEPVEDFIATCGRQLALTRSGLFELTAATTPIGTWAPVSLPPGASSSGGTLHAVDGQLFVFSPTGDVFSVTLTPCQ